MGTPERQWSRIKRLKDYASFKSAKMSFDFVASVAFSDETAISFLRQKNVIRSHPPNCQSCSREMTIIKHNGGHIYRCPSHKNKKKSLRTGSFLENSKLTYRDFVLICYSWSTERPVFRAVEEFSLSEHSVIQWYQYFRDICSKKLLATDYKIGGPNQIVQIDESLIAKAKNNVGRCPIQRWVFGGYDILTKKGFLVLVEDRTERTLLHYIQRYIRPGTIIHSDKWSAYHNIKNIPVHPPYQHFDVNHSLHFKDPITGVHTNNVECYWKNCKRRFKRMGGVQTSTLPSHLDEFLWREMYGKDGTSAMDNILEQIAHFYPV